jgi:hypothetical protein
MQGALLGCGWLVENGYTYPRLDCIPQATGAGHDFH